MSPSVSEADHRLPGWLVPGHWAAKCVPGSDVMLMSSLYIYHHTVILTWLAWPQCSLEEGWLGVWAGLSHDSDSEPELDEEKGKMSAAGAYSRGQGRSCSPAACPRRWGWRWWSPASIFRFREKERFICNLQSSASHFSFIVNCNCKNILWGTSVADESKDEILKDFSSFFEREI